MKIGILETGRPPEEIRAAFGSYPAMFAELLGPGNEYRSFAVLDGELPEDPAGFDAFLITGSSAGVYDPLPWIEPLKQFLLRARDVRVKLVGICFGHQIMAEAFGGKVEKSDKGWGIGLHTYELKEQQPWMQPAGPIAVCVSHQDQVVQLPPGARVLAASEFTPYAALEYTDQPAISFQCHPEFAPDYVRALIEARRGSRFEPAFADQALATLSNANNRSDIGAWINRFLRAA